MLKTIHTVLAFFLHVGTPKHHLFQKWALHRGADANELESLLGAFDSGDAHYLLGRAPKNLSDLDLVFRQLNNSN